MLKNRSQNVADPMKAHYSGMSHYTHT